jgi:RHS repeat-associated protein
MAVRFGGISAASYTVNSSTSITAVAPSGTAGAVDITVTVPSSTSLLEQAVYSLYGQQTIQAGSDVSPFGFQGSYTDPSGFIYLINRYYDPSSDQFISIDPAAAQTGQPYAFTGDDPLNGTDPLGLVSAGTICGQHGSRSRACRGAIKISKHVVSFELGNQASPNKHIIDIAGGVAHVAHTVAHAINAAATHAQAFGEDHLGVSAEVCFDICVGLQVQHGHFYAISGSGALVGGGLSLDITSSAPDPTNVGNSNMLGLGPASFNLGSHHEWSVGVGPKGILGWGSQSTLP